MSATTAAATTTTAWQFKYTFITSCSSWLLVHLHVPYCIQLDLSFTLCSNRQKQQLPAEEVRATACTAWPVEGGRSSVPWLKANSRSSCLSRTSALKCLFATLTSNWIVYLEVNNKSWVFGDVSFNPVLEMTNEQPTIFSNCIIPGLIFVLYFCILFSASIGPNFPVCILNNEDQPKTKKTKMWQADTTYEKKNPLPTANQVAVIQLNSQFEYM